ncbi:hypothetical protein AFLA_014178 [Aspergillus flavus NRRL3357]|nr:hypothetical protein AFLA_014178 [Aspergillus flavus NRRL3357]
MYSNLIAGVEVNTNVMGITRTKSADSVSTLSHGANVGNFNVHLAPNIDTVVHREGSIRWEHLAYTLCSRQTRT